MFGFESGMPLTQKKSIHEKEKETLDSLIGLLNLNDRSMKLISEMTSTMKSVIQTLSFRIQESRLLMSRQQFGLNKCMAIAGNNWRESRYVYVISGLQASLFNSKNSLNDISALGSFVSIAQKAVSLYHDVNAIDRSYQQNLLTLLDTEETAVLESRFIKQRSVLWHLLRMQARVTKSSLHSAIGLRGLKDQKRHSEVEQLYHFVEEGCYVFSWRKHRCLRRSFTRWQHSKTEQ